MKRALCLLFVLLFLLPASIASPETIAWIKAHCKVGDIVSTAGSVSADLHLSPAEPCCYISDPDLNRPGIKVLGFGGTEGVIYGFGSDGVTEGLIVSEDCAGEKQLSILGNPPTFSVYGGYQEPYAMPNRCIGGGPFCWTAPLGPGQRGADRGCGLNNVGMLIKTWGRVVSRVQTKQCFYIDDGSKRKDSCCSKQGIAVCYGDFPPYTVFRVPQVGEFVVVTGISAIWCCDYDGVHSVIRLRYPKDVQ